MFKVKKKKLRKIVFRGKTPSAMTRMSLGNFPGGPVAKTLCSQCTVWSLVRELDPTCYN